MKVCISIKRMVCRWVRTLSITLQVTAGSVLVLNSAQAIELNITAKFQPDSSRPDYNVFKNTTPNSGYCSTYPTECVSMFSLRLNVKSYSNAPIHANHTDPRQGAMFKLPAQWRDLTVTHEKTGHQQTVRVRIKGFGSQYQTVGPIADLVGGGVSPLEAHRKLWGDTWVNAPLPCMYSGVGAYGVNNYSFFWRTPVEGVCAKKARYDIPSLQYSFLDIAYELQTPNPLNMSSGLYTGSLNYTAGPLQDFDMGDVMIPADSSIKLNFTLTVEHTLKVVIPPGGNRVELVPKGGWHQWVLNSRIPEKLVSDQAFLVSASSRFKMLLACERVMGDTCALKNSLNTEVPVQVYVTMPSGIADSNGAPINRKPLLISGQGTEQFQPSRYVDRNNGMLHFEIEKRYVEEMLNQEGTYKGNVTVIWDSEV